MEMALRRVREAEGGPIFALTVRGAHGEDDVVNAKQVILALRSAVAKARVRCRQETLEAKCVLEQVETRSPSCSTLGGDARCR